MSGSLHYFRRFRGTEDITVLKWPGEIPPVSWLESRRWSRRARLDEIRREIRDTLKGEQDD